MKEENNPLSSPGLMTSMPQLRSVAGLTGGVLHSMISGLCLSVCLLVTLQPRSSQDSSGDALSLFSGPLGPLAVWLFPSHLNSPVFPFLPLPPAHPPHTGCVLGAHAVRLTLHHQSHVCLWPHPLTHSRCGLGILEGSSRTQGQPLY